MTNPNADPEAHGLAAILADIQDRLATLERGGQLARSSIVGSGAIKGYSFSGEQTLQVGQQADGSWGTVAMNGPTPPQPAAPTVTPITSGVMVAWHGEWADQDASTPLDLAHVDIVTSTDPNADFVHLAPSQMFVSGNGGEIAVLTGDEQGPVYVRLIVRTTSGKSSLPSPAGSATPAPVIAFADEEFPVTFSGRQFLNLRHTPYPDSLHVKWNGRGQDRTDWTLDGRDVTFYDDGALLNPGDLLSCLYAYPVSDPARTENPAFGIDQGPEVRPIAGRTDYGGACYDPITGQALYVAFNPANGSVEVYRTRDGYESLSLVNSSVDLLTAVSTDTWNAQMATGIQRIDGTVYVVISGKSAVQARGGAYVYRDTSTLRNGSGPYVLHGAMHNVALSGGQPYSGGVYDNAMVGQIEVTPTGRWIAGCAFKAPFGSNDTVARFGMVASDDKGLTWYQTLNVGWYIVGGIYGYMWSRNYAYYRGQYWTGGRGNVDPDKHAKSGDGATWTLVGNLGVQGKTFPLASGGTIYRWNFSNLEAATADPDTLPAWTPVASVSFGTGALGGEMDPLVVNIGPDTKPLWVAISRGLVKRIGRGVIVGG